MSASCSGRGRKAKAGLNKGIRDTAWAEFRRQLDYKTAAVGGHLVAVNPAYTSQQCRVCGHNHKDNRRTQALFLCVACGHTENADLNASQNILARGQRQWQEIKDKKAAGHAASACGGNVRQPKRLRARVAVPMKQEPAKAHPQGCTEGADCV